MFRMGTAVSLSCTDFQNRFPYKFHRITSQKHTRVLFIVSHAGTHDCCSCPYKLLHMTPPSDTPLHPIPLNTLPSISPNGSTSHLLTDSSHFFHSQHISPPTHSCGYGLLPSLFPWCLGPSLSRPGGFTTSSTAPTGTGGTRS